jgi:hypothetical protein
MIPSVYQDPRITYYRNQNRNNSEYGEFKILDVETIKADVVECFGALLARCWVDRELVQDLRNDPHYCLLQNGMVLPKSLDITVEIYKETNRLQISVFEIKDDQIEKICSLRLSMLASS